MTAWNPGESAEELYNQAPCGYITTDADGLIIRTNDTFLNWTGYSREELLSVRRFQDLLTVPGRIFHDTHYAPLLRLHGVANEIAFDVLRPGRAPLPVFVNSVEVRDGAGRPVQVRTSLFNATERRLYERELQLARRRAEQLAAIVEHSGDAMFSTGLEGEILSWNSAAAKLYGYTAAEAIGGPATRVVPPDRMQQRREMAERVIAGATLCLETVTTNKEGNMLDVAVTAAPIRDLDGRVAGISESHRDISERRAAEAALRERERRLRLALRVGKAYAYELDAAADVLARSAGFEEVLGSPAEERANMREHLARVHAEDRPGLVQRLGRLSPAEPGLNAEYRVVRPDGSVAWVEDRGYASFAPDGRLTHLFGIAADITARKTAEEVLARDRETLEAIVKDRTAELEQTHMRLRLSERMAVIGTMSAGLAHDLSNLLLPIRARLDSILRAELPPKAAENALAIRHSTDYLRRLASSLRLLAADPDGDRQVDTDLAEWLRDTEGLYKSTLPPGVKLHASVPERLAAAVGRTALTQAVFNLVHNAGEMLAGRADGAVTISVAREAGSVALTVADNGPGMTEEQRQRCMEPFYSTRKERGGSGLGLAVVAAIVRRAGGSVRVQSEVGAGAAFTLVLPPGKAPTETERPQVGAVSSEAHRA
ncbi:MAG TPA: PAS domain S-box protein [Phycisphaerales bacterium]|nr:PAS domain S-box protein [Phycisphaerales bacterium]